jgi:tRNA(Arg) A34 adenosine deaminase TadA
MTHEEFMKEACRVNSSVGALITYGLHPIARGFWGIHPRYQNLPVFHAEAMAILNAKLDRGNCNGATLYVNKSPCRNCAELIIQAGDRKDMAIHVQNRARHYGEPNLQQSGYYWFWDAVDSKGRKCQLRIDVYERGETDIIIIYDDISILYGLITSPHSSNLSSFSEEGGNK